MPPSARAAIDEVVVPPWEIHERIGQDPWSAWFRARLGGEDVLVRAFDRAQPDLDFMEMRLEEDGGIGERLRHPGLLAIVAHARLAYAIPFVEGWTVANLRPLSLPAALGVARAICDVLHYLHTHPLGPVIHRWLDLESVIVDDAGVVRLAEPALHHLAHRCDPGVLARPSDLAYLSPEAVRGEPLGIADQVFRVGALLHGMVAGQSPFLRASPFETLMAIRDGEPRLDARFSGPRSHDEARGRAPYRSSARAPLSTRLGGVLRRALARKPGDRFATVAALHEELAAIESELSPGGRAPLLDEARASGVAARPAPFLPAPSAGQVDRRPSGDA